MIHSESVQRAYSWAFNVYNNRKSRFIDLFCARAILQAIEDAQDNADVAHDALVQLVREWTAQRRDGLERPIKTLGKMLNVEPEELSTTLHVEPQPLR